jgi:hypothetical protein
MFIYEPPEPLRTVRRIQDGAPIQRQERVLRYVSEGWLPANPQLLKRIEQEMAQGVYEQDHNALLQKIQSDPGLFIRCLRELPAIDAEAARTAPLEGIAQLSQEKLLQLLNKASEQYTLHHFNKATVQQSLRIQHTLAASLTSTQLALQTKLSHADALASTMFIELGMNLIAWNYPSVYSDVMARHRRNGDEIEANLERLLGIAPLRIGWKFATQWGMPAHVREALVRTYAAPTEALSLQEICRAAQLVADSFDQHNFPRAERQLDAIRNPLRKLITPKLIEEIRSSVAQIFQEYTLPKSAFRGHLSLAAANESTDPEAAKDALLQRNIYLLRCSEEVKSLFRPCYALAQARTVSKEAISALVANVVPQLGFNAGCLYLTQTNLRDAGKLTPALCFGGRSISEYQNFYQQLAGSVSGTLYSHAPYRTRSEGISGSDAWLIFASLEHSRYEGVLFFEETPEIADESSQNLLHFQAVRRALNQFLGEE